MSSAVSSSHARAFGSVGEVAGLVALGLEVEEKALGEMFFVFDEDDEG